MYRHLSSKYPLKFGKWNIVIIIDKWCSSTRNGFGFVYTLVKIQGTIEGKGNTPKLKLVTLYPSSGVNKYYPLEPWEEWRVSLKLKNSLVHTPTLLHTQLPVHFWKDKVVNYFPIKSKKLQYLTHPDTNKSRYRPYRWNIYP